MLRRTFALAALVALASFGSVQAQDPEYVDQTTYPYAYLFQNYWAYSPNPNGAPAQLYVSPLPTPPIAGRTYITYPPFHPHQYLWQHSRVYYGNGTRTTVTWGWRPRCCHASSKYPMPTHYPTTNLMNP